MSAICGTNLRVTAVAFLLLLSLASVRDLIPVARGAGYDGQAYAQWARILSIPNLKRLLTKESGPKPALPIDSYRARRFLPSMVVYYGLGAVGSARRHADAIMGFTVANIFLVSLAVWLWCISADSLELGDRAKWLALPLLMVSYANLKMPLFYPTLTDSFALAMGSACLALHLHRMPWAVLLIGILSAGVWPSMPLFCALLVAFPYSGPREDTPGPGRLPTLVAAAIAAGGFGYISFLVLTGYSIPSTPVTPITALAIPSAAIAGAALFFGLRPLLDSGNLWASVHPRALLRAGPWLVAAGALVVFAEWLPGRLANQPPQFASERLVNEIFWSSANQPATFWLAHMLYYGPLLAFLPFVWNRLAREVTRHGTGLVGSFGLAVVLGLGSESRKWINFLPFLVLFLIAALRHLEWTRARLTVWFALALIVSKVWLPMDRALDLPWLGEVDWRQLYQSSRGPWIDEWVYALQLVPLLAVVGLAWRWSREARD